MPPIRGLQINPPLLNSACPWASSERELHALFGCPYTGAVTTRTATARGFPEDPSIHTVAFASSTTTSINSYGYSPFPLTSYLSWVRACILDSPGSSKPIIVSITSSVPAELSIMLEQIQYLRAELRDTDPDAAYVRVGVELNTSCPNIPNTAPPAYDLERLKPLLDVLASHWGKDNTLVLGLKLAPFVYRLQQVQLVDLIAAYSTPEGTNPVAFFTCTNTLGNCVMYKETGHDALTLPGKFGGLGGESIHYLALGNVVGFKEILRSHAEAGVRGIGIIGVGGVVNRDGYKRMIAAGADAVACATALGMEGIVIFEKLSRS